MLTAKYGIVIPGNHKSRMYYTHFLSKKSEYMLGNINIIGVYQSASHIANSMHELIFNHQLYSDNNGIDKCINIVHC